MTLRNEDYLRIEKAILYLGQNFHHRPDLQDVARRVNLSEYHFQRLFRRWAGISPKRLVQFLTVEYAKQVLETSQSLLEATYDSGLSSPGRLHDLFVKVEAMTPGEFKAKGSGLRIDYGFHPSPFGECFLAVTGRGICGLGFVHKDGRAKLLRDFKARWSEARVLENPRVTQPYIDHIFGEKGKDGNTPMTLLLKGTNFQIKVWEALLKIPMGLLTSYGDVAVSIGAPGASRAVGSAVGQNPVAFLIPCHRVIRKIGVCGDYHWGAPRKKAMLAWEAARTHTPKE